MTAQDTPSTTVQLGYQGLECPITGELCPTRVRIDELCTPSTGSDTPWEFLQEAQEDPKKRSILLMLHNGAINKFGCDAVAGVTQCPPSVESNRTPAVTGVKKIIKAVLTYNK